MLTPQFWRNNTNLIIKTMSINKVMLIGNVGNNPEIRNLQDGKKVANLSLATNESWRDKVTGERKQVTEWHRVVVLSQGLVGVVEGYIQKGSKLYIEGKIKTRKWTDSKGVDKYATEIVIQGFNDTLQIHDPKDVYSNEDNKKQKEEVLEKISFEEEDIIPF